MEVSKAEVVSEEKIILSVNQEKVIRDKYLRDDPSPEVWLRRVARNIALAELFYAPEIEGALRSVSCSAEEVEVGKNVFAKMFLFHKGLASHNERSANFRRLVENLCRLAEETEATGRIVKEHENKFYKLLSDFEFLPNSPTLMNAGRELQQLSACYVLPIEDSIEGWMDAARNAAIIHKSGGGTGFAVSRVRPAGDSVKTSKGISSGPLSPLLIINAVTEQIKQGGTRRGANMGILSVYHPNIFEFISMKKQQGLLENFNISVALDEKFMRAVERNEEIELVNPKSKQITRKVKAREIFDAMCQNAWETGDPGFVVIDRINASNSNPTPALGEIESTNPCGEQPLLSYEPCNLGSINLSKFITDGKINFGKLRETTELAVRFLDNVIDINNYPIPEIEAMAKGNRRIGLGVMGWAEMLVQLGIPYDSEEAIKKAEEVMKFINDAALEASEELAEERGVFPNFKNSIYDESGEYFRKRAKPRNCARTTIAPTGTIAIAAGLQGSGIEPFFSIAYVRYNAKGIDALKRGEQPDENNVFYEHNNLFGEIAKKNNFFGLEEKELWRKIAENHGSVRGVREIPENLQKLFACAYDVTTEYHIKHQAAFQRYTDNAVSKTINMPNSATVEDVRNAYWFAFNEGAKGVTIYRDGSKSFQVLATVTKKEKTPAASSLQPADANSRAAGTQHPAPSEVIVRERPEEVSGTTYKIKTGYGNLYVTINNDSDGKPFEVFATTGKTGGVLAAKCEAICRLVSLALRSNIPADELIEQLKGIRGPMPAWSKHGIVLSIPDAISKILGAHINKGQTKLEEFAKKNGNGSSNGHGATKKKSIADTGEVPECPDCHNILEFGEGCATCQFCGYSKCS